MTPDHRNSPDIQNAGTGLAEAERLRRVFTHRSVIGFCTCDPQLRYLSINRALAESNGVAAAAHLGNTVRDICGDVSQAVEPALQRVRATGEIILKRISGTLPHRKGLAHWIAVYFPLKGAENKIQRMAVLAVDVTEVSRLEESLFRLDHKLGRAMDRKVLLATRRLHHSIDHYFTALSTSLGQLPRQLSRIDRSADEQSALLVEALDLRIMTMRTLVSAVAEHLSIDLSPQ